MNRPRRPDDPPEYEPVGYKALSPCAECVAGAIPELCRRLLCLPGNRPDGRQCAFARSKTYGNEED